LSPKAIAELALSHAVRQQTKLENLPALLGVELATRTVSVAAKDELKVDTKYQ
jgi:hypothetical protein